MLLVGLVLAVVAIVRAVLDVRERVARLEGVELERRRDEDRGRRRRTWAP